MLKLKSLMSLATSVALTFAGLVGFASPVSATVAESYDFNTAGALATNFDVTLGAGSTSLNYSQTTTGGIANSGAINAPSSLSAVFASKNSYSKGSVGSKYTFSSFLQSIGNSGYSGMGFSATPSSASGYPYRPNDALGISVHGGGFVFHVRGQDYNGSWSSGGSNITAVKTSSVSDLLNNGSVDDWYKVFFIVEIKSSTTFDITVEVWSANGTTGELRSASADAIFAMRSVTNADISGANTLKSYINFSGDRVRYFDNFAVELAGNASVIAAGAPVVLTNPSSLIGSQITFNGEVTSENGSSVTERGFVYGLSPNPTVSDTKVVDGTGSGTFTETTANLAAGTYYVRAFATNGTGTSYGSEESISIVAAPTITWNPSTTSVYRSANTLTPSPLASSNSAGAITYSVQSAGSTGCTVNSATGVISFTAAGDCVVRATVASSSPYSAGNLDKTFTVLANTAPGAPTNVTASAGNAKATITWSAPSSNGGSNVSSYTVTAAPGGATCDATASATTCEVVGLTNGTTYTFSVTATNSTGVSSQSPSSAGVTPVAPVQAPSGAAPVVPQPVPTPVTQVSNIQLEPGKTLGSSKIKLKLSGAQSEATDTDIQIKLFDFNGKLIRTITVPITGSAETVEVVLPLKLGEFLVEAATVNEAGGMSKPVSPVMPILQKSFFSTVSKNNGPSLVGQKIASPIRFAANSSKLSETYKKALVDLANRLKEKNPRLAITGFAAEAGASLSFEKKLASERAKSVARFLRSQGLSNVLYFAGFGAVNEKQNQVNFRKAELRQLK
jgi:flagellar motor protein MotB